ncbi:MAG: TlpA family protein disulfide reductase [Bacteroidales bacterium]|nr:TlpA family protein disulfide reductase [Bacteroidales bacterium]
MKNIKSLIVVLLSMAAFLGTSILAGAQSKNQKLTDGFTDISASSPSGKAVKLSDYLGKGNYVLVDFWASWCGPCKRETPYIIDVYNKYGKKGLTVVGIAVSDKKEDSIKAAKELGIPYELMLEPSEADIKAYGVRAIPTLMLFSPDGTIVRAGMREGSIEKAVKETLKL